MTIGEKIRETRKNKGLTQKLLSELIGIAEPTIRKYESGRLNPKHETLGKIAAALDCSIGYLRGETDSPYEGTYEDLEYNVITKLVPYVIMSIADEKKVLASYPATYKTRDKNGAVGIADNLTAYQAAIVQRALIKEIEIDSECKDKLLKGICDKLFGVTPADLLD